MAVEILISYMKPYLITLYCMKYNVKGYILREASDGNN